MEDRSCITLKIVFEFPNRNINSYHLVKNNDANQAPTFRKLSSEIKAKALIAATVASPAFNFEGRGIQIEKLIYEKSFVHGVLRQCINVAESFDNVNCIRGESFKVVYMYELVDWCYGKVEYYPIETMQFIMSAKDVQEGKLIGNFYSSRNSLTKLFDRGER